MFTRTSRLNVILTWSFNIGVLVLIERTHGLEFKSLSPALVWLHIRRHSAMAHILQYHDVEACVI